MSEFKVGDKVWVKGTINGTLPADGDLDEAVFVQFEIPSVMVGGIVAVAGSEIVPAASVVSDADRAAVGRLATYCNRTLQLALDNLRSTPMSDPTWMRKSKDLEIIESAFDTGDIEAAQRVANGGA